MTTKIDQATLDAAQASAELILGCTLTPTEGSIVTEGQPACEVTTIRFDTNNHRGLDHVVRELRRMRDTDHERKWAYSFKTTESDVTLILLSRPTTANDYSMDVLNVTLYPGGYGIIIFVTERFV